MSGTAQRGYPFVVLESRDGCGKTTVSEALNAILGGSLVKTPSEPVDRFRKVYDNCGNYEARYLYYLSTLVLASEKIEMLLRVGPVVCDRYISSAVIYHQLLGVDTSMVDVAKLGLIQPTLTICLICDEDVLHERMYQRGEAKEDHIEDIISLNEVDRLMRATIPQQVDTSTTTPLEAAQLIAAML